MAETKPILRSSNSNSVPDAENPEEVTKSSEINETYSSDKENAGKNASVEASVIETSKEQRVPKKKRSLSKKAGLAFPVMRIFKKTNSINKNIKYRKVAAVFMTAVLEYLAEEILELAGTCATQNKKRRITKRHMLFAIRQDEELDQLFKDVVIPGSGVLPHIENFLLPKRTASKGKKSSILETLGEQ